MNSTLLVALTIIGAAAAVVSLILYMKDRRKREITYRLGKSRQLYSQSLLGADGFRLELNDRPVEELFLVRLEVENSGNEVLRAEDFLRNVALEWDGNAKMFPVEVDRENTDVELSHSLLREGESKRLVLNSPLFEPGDKITIEVLYDSPDEVSVTFDARVVNGEVRSGDYSEQNFHEEFQRKISYRRKHTFKEMLVFFGVFLGSTVTFVKLGQLVVSLTPAHWAQSVGGRGLSIAGLILFVLAGFVLGMYAVIRFSKWMRARDTEGLETVTPMDGMPSTPTERTTSL